MGAQAAGVPMSQPQSIEPLWALEILSLTKSFDRPAVDGLDLTVRAGEFYALLGPNGSGKTTTFKMVVGLLRPDSGSISVLGIDALADPVAANQITAWISDEPIERMADRIGVIAGGQLIAQGTLEELREQAGKSRASLEDTFLALVASQTVAA
jgi:ABC-type multidrug transport system ATPase subunit